MLMESTNRDYAQRVKFSWLKTPHITYVRTPWKICLLSGLTGEHAHPLHATEVFSMPTPNRRPLCGYQAGMGQGNDHKSTLTWLVQLQHHMQTCSSCELEQQWRTPQSSCTEPRYLGPKFPLSCASRNKSQGTDPIPLTCMSNQNQPTQFSVWISNTNNWLFMSNIQTEADFQKIFSQSFQTNQNGEKKISKPHKQKMRIHPLNSAFALLKLFYVLP